MDAIVIKSKSKDNLRLLIELAEKLGEAVTKLSEEQMEDLAFGKLMKKGRTRDWLKSFDFRAREYITFQMAQPSKRAEPFFWARFFLWYFLLQQWQKKVQPQNFGLPDALQFPLLPRQLSSATAMRRRKLSIAIFEKTN